MTVKIPATMRVVPQYLQDRLLEKQWRAMVWLNRRKKVTTTLP